MNHSSSERITTMKGALKVALIVLMLMFSIASKGQSPLFKCIEINRYVEQNKLQRDSTLYKVLTVWDSYLQLNGAERATSQYWSNEEKEYFGADCDLRYRYIDFSYRKNIEKYYSPTILSVTKIENEFAIKTLFYKINDSDRKVYVTDIINVFVKQEGNKLLLQSALFRNLKLFHKIKMGNINTYSIKNNQLSSSILFKLDSINQAVAKIYRCSPLEIHYFLNNSISDYQHLRGFDYGQTMFISTKEGKSQEGAITEMANKIIFNGNPDPVKYFTHEVAHIYTYHLFSLNNIEGTYHDIIDEGISYGQSLPKYAKKIRVDERQNAQVVI